MLTLYRGRALRGERPTDLAQDLPLDILWIDLLRPEPGEIAFVERATGVAVPSIADLSEIESSSRLRQADDVLYLSTPMVIRARAHDPRATPVGFVLTREHLITVRFEELPAFASFVEHLGKNGAASHGSVGVFAGLVDSIVDRTADTLEIVGAELDALSDRLFRRQMAAASKLTRPARQDADLRETLRRVGSGGEVSSKIRDSLLGIGRILPYVAESDVDWLPQEIKPRLETLRRDVVSLNDYNSYLTNKVQFLLDATLGLINIEQNNIIKVLTVVSLVGIPPTLIASIYGMNFKNMPELSWAWGYPYGLTLIALSAILPLLWFKWRGWF